MSKPFDATLKDLIQSYPADFLAVLGEPAPGPVEALNVDLSTLTAAADAVLRRSDGELVHLEFESGSDPSLPRRALLYNTALYHRETPPAVHTIVVLLRPKADHVTLTGKVQYRSAMGKGALDFRYDVVRVWTRPMEVYLQGGLGTLPLAVLGRPPRGRRRVAVLPEVIRRIAERSQEERPGDSPKVLLATYVLTGLRVAKPVVDRLFRGVPGMEDSTTYQGILEDGRREGRLEGRLEGVRKLLLRQARKRFKRSNAAAEAVLQAITDMKQLERLGERLMDAGSWTDWLNMP